jgi:hypothetical protein
MLLILADHINYFMANTTARWFIRTTEDAFVHLKRLPLMIRELESLYDPLNDFVFHGQSVPLGDGVVFVHGGSGWIMSRFACEFYRNNRTYIETHVQDSGSGDDVMPTFLCGLRHMTWREMESPRWIGSPLDDEANQRLVDGNYSDLWVCPSVAFQLDRDRPGRAVRDLVVWHSGRLEMVVVLAGYRVAAEAPSDVMLVHAGDTITLCRSDPEQADAWNERWAAR